MLVKSITALAALTLAAGVAAEPMPYKPAMMKTSVRSLFGVVRRDDSGYQPQQAACGAGNTCAEACGAGFEACSTSDNQVHCYNQGAGEICCPNKSGNSCDAGYYCSADTKGETWCCPESMDLAACAAAYTVTGGLVKQTAPASTSTSTSSSSTSSAAPTTTSTTSSSSSSTAASTTSSPASTSHPSSFPSYVPSASIVPPPSSNTSVVTSVYSPKPSQTQQTQTAVPTGAASVAGPVSGLVLLAAGLAALF